MKKNEFKEDLVNFIKEATCSFTCVREVARRLSEEGFKELYESDVWKLDGDKFFVVRNDASIIAFVLPKKKSDIFSIITSHSDTPSLLLKPDGAYVKENYLKYNVMPYGGLLNYGWLDHPLGMAGRVVVKENNKLNTKIIDFKKPMAIVPSVAIHQNDKANSNLDLNMQIDLQPIVSLSNDKNTWDDILKKEVNKEIVDYDLFLYGYQEPFFFGKKDEFLMAPRIDNLTSVYSSLISFLESNSSNIKVFCSFNNEEIGSLTEEGADSNFLIDMLKRIASHIDIDIASSLSKSFIISADNTHAIHPNHVEYADDTGVAFLGKGFAIVRESSSTTNGVSSAIVKELCDKKGIKYQDATAKNDLVGGSTLSGISLRHVSVLSIDVGVAQLAMHSSYETCAVDDIIQLYKMMCEFYNTRVVRGKDSVVID